MKTVSKYGISWKIHSGDPEIEVEKACVRKGGQWKDADGTVFGLGLFQHYKNLWKLWWPDDDEHRWADLILKNILGNRYCSLLGPGSSSKTYTAAKYALTDYACFPDETMVLCSSTEGRSAELRIWGDLKSLWERAKEQDEDFPGHVIDYLKAISTEEAGDGKIRDLRKGIIFIPCLSDNGAFKGLGKWQGAKQKRVRLIADECAIMKDGFLNAIPNLRHNPDFRAIFIGNPIGMGDPLDKVSEPVCGWNSHPVPEKTTVWDTRFFNGVCVNLIGTDSPNFDFPGPPWKYNYLTRPDTIAETLAVYGMNSSQYWSQNVGARVTGLVARKVITRQMCEEHHALEPPTWMNNRRVRVYAVDAAYGVVGGDRCVGGYIEFGLDETGRMILHVAMPTIIRIQMGKGGDAEDQIAAAVRDECIAKDIPPENVFHDATGRGSLGTSFARLWSSRVNPVEFGGSPTARPVRYDLFIRDPRTGERRLKLCHEEYGNFVTELWYSVQHTILSGQLRGLPLDVMEEGCLREWLEVRGNKVQVETKEKMKKRIGKSPDLFDWCFEAGTKILTPYGHVPIESLKVGSLIVTPLGISSVWKTSNRLIDEVTTVEFSNGSILSGAGEHKIFTRDNGWVRLDSLTIDNECQSEYALPAWHLLNMLFTKESSTGFKALVDIIRETKNIVNKRDFFTESSGKSTTDVFLLACASIIKMVTGLITKSEIYSCLHEASTCLTTWLKGLNFPSGLVKRFLPSVEFSLLNGMGQLKEGAGTVKTPTISGSISENQSLVDVPSVEKHSTHHFQHEPSSAQFLAVQKQPLERRFLIKEVVRCVVKVLLRISTGRHHIAPVTVRQSRPPESKRVYNLTLQDHNAYYANGILVSNCATAVEGARRLGFEISRLPGAFELESNNFLDKEEKKTQNLLMSKLLTHA